MKKGDKYLLGIIIFITVIGFLVFKPFQEGEKGDLLVIEIEGEVYKEISFESGPEIEEVELVQKDGKLNSLIIDRNENRVRIKDANCPDKICLNAGWIENKNELIVCLPNRVVVKIAGDENEVDDISY